MLTRAFVLTVALVAIGLIKPETASAIIGVGARASYVNYQNIDDNALMVGLMGRLRMGLIGFEAAVERRSNEFDDGSELKIYPLSASVLIHPLPVVYGVAGLGLYRSTITVPTFADQTENSIGFHYGAGVEWPFLPLVKLIGDVRYQIVDFEYDVLPSPGNKVDANALVISAGVMISL